MKMTETQPEIRSHILPFLKPGQMQVGPRPLLSLSPEVDWLWVVCGTEGSQQSPAVQRRECGRGVESEGSDKDTLVHSNPILVDCKSFSKHCNPVHLLDSIKIFLSFHTLFNLIQ